MNIRTNILSCCTKLRSRIKVEELELRKGRDLSSLIGLKDNTRGEDIE